jgi:hypothetical protein
MDLGSIEELVQLVKAETAHLNAAAAAVDGTAGG